MNGSSTYSIPRLAFHLSAGSGNQQEPLTETEKSLQKILAQIDGPAVFRTSLRVAGKTSDVRLLRKTISMLKDQLRDAPEPLKEVIGQPGIALLRLL